ncbi:hypothetical protein H6G80_11025 [Nostoc sp. FACHB-87]|uniref:hypothetical protein n=1 Tax=Nostocales TaxID=1161 RepID=UPI001686705C|nr:MULTISPECIES: hypothetical protein [Nostocales]MBD2454612.1 hypothetical protein [Nostoc sp. FACHB-87]MBD2476343.1 hypothetical protein [Anabaena sp. FACHB-83]MBD2488288.1 hypothetical protein [Aulosira sp. FACHB-615]
MLKRSFFVGLLMSLLTFLSISNLPTAALSSNSFPQTWQGTWSGTLYDRTVSGKSQTVPMKLRIKLISQDPIRYTWQITYGTGSKKLVRNYELVAKNQDAGHFAIDEKDGTIIDTWWLGEKLYSQFRVKNLLLSTQCQLQDNKLHYELVVYQPTTTPESNSTEQPFFESYQLRTIQFATLTPVKSDIAD